MAHVFLFQHFKFDSHDGMDEQMKCDTELGASIWKCGQ